MDVGGAAGGLDLFAGGVHAGVEQVGQNGIVEEIGFLRDHADGIVERIEGHVAQIMPVDQDAAVDRDRRGAGSGS